MLPENWRDNIQEPWEILDDPQSSEFETELQNELSSGHDLYGETVRAIARRVDLDDFLFQTSAGLSVVHLSFAGKEKSPFPVTTNYDSWADFVENKLLVDVKYW